jgi:hypothetical protein
MSALTVNGVTPSEPDPVHLSRPAPSIIAALLKPPRQRDLLLAADIGSCRVALPDGMLADLQDRVAATRWPRHDRVTDAPS